MICTNCNKRIEPVYLDNAKTDLFLWRHKLTRLARCGKPGALSNKVALPCPTAQISTAISSTRFANIS